MGKYFGTDGFRGEANVDMTVEHAFGIGRFLGHYFSGEHKANVLIGKDTRRSSYMYECALAAGLTASGANAHLMHVTSTPGVAYITRIDDFDCGIMISASHNPYHDNGIKLFNGQGEKMGEAVIAELERYLDGGAEPLSYATGGDIGRTVDYVMGRNRYIAYLISLSRHSFKGMKIGLDCANGSAWMIAKSVFDALGADTYVIGAKPDGVNINVDCGSTDMRALRSLVLERGLDVGFAFDGDADRCLAIDEMGRYVSGDELMYVCAKHMKQRGSLDNDTLVTTVMSNYGLYKALDELGIKYEKTAVGDKYVWENMRENGHTLGGEQSGHIIFGKYSTTGDGVLTAINVMQVLMDANMSLGKLISPLKIYPQILKNVVVDDKDATLTEGRVQEVTAEQERALEGRGRVLLRKSGTEPLLRVMAEAESIEACERSVDAIIDAMRDTGHLIKVK